MSDYNAGRNYHITGLDGLRGLACLAVFASNFHRVIHDLRGRFWHFDVSRFLEGGSGVVTLFILSGFLLSIPFWNAVYTGKNFPSISSFWIKRLSRLVPAYFICLTFLVIHNRPEFIDNLLHYLFLHAFTEFSFYSINPPFWALGIIAQLYLILPLIFLLSRKISPSNTFTVVLLISVGSYGAHFGLMTYAQSLSPWPFNPDMIRPDGIVLTHSVLAHLPHFLMGVLGAYLFLFWQRKKRMTSKHYRAFCDITFWISTCAVLVVLSTPLEEFLQIPYGRYNLPLIPLLLTIMILHAPHGYTANRLLDSSPLRFMGAISYGIYVYHLPILNFTSRHIDRFGLNTNDDWIILGLTSLTLTIVVASSSYFLFERPILRITRKILTKRNLGGDETYLQQLRMGYRKGIR